MRLKVEGLSLRTKLLAAAAALVLLPGGIYGAIALERSRAALAQAGGRWLMQEAQGAADRLATVLRSDVQRLEALAAQDVMREIRIADLDKRISTLLVSALRSCAACIELSISDSRRRVIAASAPERLGQEDRAPPGITGPFAVADADADRLSVAVAVPDPDSAERRLGQLVALFDWQRLTQLTERVRSNLQAAGVDAVVLIVDGQGQIIGGAYSGASPWPAGTRVQLPTAAVATGHVDARAEMLLGYAALPAGLPAWTLLVAQPLEQAFAPARRTGVLLAAALFTVLAVALLAALLAARRVTRPLAQLAAAAAAVGRGERPVPALQVQSRDEVGTLTAAFNGMAADLARIEHSLVEAAKFSFVGELAAGVAHEVRTPLGVLRSSAQLLACSPELKDEDSLELLRLLQSEVDRIDRVVSALLDLGRPRELRAEASPLGPLLLRAAKFVEVQARQKHVVVRRGAFSPDPILHCDPELIYQVVLNLLVNAVQILPEGGALDVSLLPPADGYAGFEVRDNGPGMTEEVRARVFEPFFTRRDGGTGLGLTFVQHVVQEHRGKVLVDSAPGRGTAFRVLLPLAEGG